MLCWSVGQYLGTSPRLPGVNGSKIVYTASEISSWQIIPAHLEMSFRRDMPKEISFWAHVYVLVKVENLYLYLHQRLYLYLYLHLYVYKMYTNFYFYLYYYLFFYFCISTSISIFLAFSISIPINIHRAYMKISRVRSF